MPIPGRIGGIVPIPFGLRTPPRPTTIAAMKARRKTGPRKPRPADSPPQPKPTRRPAPPEPAPPAPKNGLPGGTQLFAALLVLAVLLAYQPAWHGDFIWDDNGHITRPDLRNWHGLFRIWFDLGATQQYYPVVHSAFWIEHQLWGDATFGYHLVNILLHSAAALLLCLILRRLSIPGAFLAAAIFALHPVHVESVAWITEQKNTLSAVLGLAAVLAYLRFDSHRRKADYTVALILFALALLSKTVTATLPPALLVVFWWRSGRLDWRRDVLPLLPFFLLAVAGGLLTIWVERTFIGTQGEQFEFTLPERLLIAGRAVWFYLAKLAWPTDLIFIYPRWEINPSAWWQYLYPLGMLALLAFAWLRRGHSRTPCATLLLFGGMLFPAIGAVSVYGFRYSFVADHYQYLASTAVITTASAGIVLLLRRCHGRRRTVGYALILALLGTLPVLTWRQSRIYAHVEGLYENTLARNPSCWMAHNNLGLTLAARGLTEEAEAHYRKAVALNPRHAEAHNNLGNIAADRRQFDQAIASYRLALAADPHYAQAHNNLGNALARTGRIDEATAHFRRAFEERPDFAAAYSNLGNALSTSGKFEEAIVQYRKAVQIAPDYAEAHNNLGLSLFKTGQIDAAVVHYRLAVANAPAFFQAHNNLANALATRGDLAEAVVQYRKALKIQPAYAEAQRNLEIVLARMRESR